MKRRGWVIAGAVVLAVGVVAYGTRNSWSPIGAVAQAPSATPPRAVAVEVGEAVTKMTPVVLDALGNVTPIASVALKARIDSEIVGIHFADGARVKQGDVLVTLDCRSIEAQVLQAEANIARDKAQLEGAERDLRRYTELVAKNATPVTNLDNTKTQAAVYAATMKANEALLKSLQVQQSYCTIRAPISGRMSAATLKIGNAVRSADILPIATIIQTAPVYVTFPLPQSSLPALRQALASESATVDAAIPGENKHASGAVTMIENTVDQSTGMVMVRATMPNDPEVLWPGSLVNTTITVREERAVTVPSAAVQVSRTGTFVFTIKDGVAKIVPVKVARALGEVTVLESGLAGGETVVTDGHLQLRDGSRVAIRERKKAGT